MISAARMRGGAAEHHQVEQRVGAQPIGAVDRHAGRLADRHQAGHDAGPGCPAVGRTTSQWKLVGMPPML